MTIAPLIAMKSTKCESLEAVAKELDRRAHTYKNDVDQSRSHLNVNYCVRKEDARPMPLDEAIDRRMAELTTKRKMRENQVRAMGFVVSTNDALDDGRAHDFLAESVSWFADRYGRENLLAAAEHYDEGTPHVQLWIAPVIRDDETGYDRLCAKELFSPDTTRKNPETGKCEVVAKGTMSKLQEDFWREVASKYGFERPLPKELRQKGYRSLEAYKQHVGTTRELKDQIKSLENEVVVARKEAAAAKCDLADVEKEKAELEAECSRLEAENEHLEAEVVRAQGILARIVDALADVLACARVRFGVSDYAQGVIDNLDAILDDIEAWHEKREQARAARDAAVTERRVGFFGTKREKSIDTERGFAAAVDKACEQIADIETHLKEVKAVHDAMESERGAAVSRQRGGRGK